MDPLSTVLDASNVKARLQIGAARPRPGAYPTVPGSPARAWQFHSFIGVNPLQLLFFLNYVVERPKSSLFIHSLFL
jgi:hypothetical protein